MKKIWMLVVLVIVVVAIRAGVSWFQRSEPEVTAAIRGREVAENLGCFACHGEGGVGGIADPLAPGRKVPGWEAGVAELYVTSEQDIRDWILHGSPQSPAYAKHHDADQLLVPMPAYGSYLTEQELDDLVAYFLAVSGWNPDLPDAVYEGRKTAGELGCFGCHGPAGMGGMSNPGSFKGYIPAWDGEDFGELVRNEEELREWILDGRTERLWNNPAARVFLERQKTPMPAYREHLSRADVNNLVAYILWLRKGQPWLDESFKAY
jgi:mono/diheme cytochrome c family protein